MLWLEARSITRAKEVTEYHSDFSILRSIDFGPEANVSNDRAICGGHHTLTLR